MKEKTTSTSYICGIQTPQGKDGYFRPYEYVCDEHYDCVPCPEDKVMEHKIITREGYV